MADDRSGRTKNMLLRLDPELAERLQAVAAVEGRSVSDVAREAIATLVQQRRTDKQIAELADLDAVSEALTEARVAGESDGQVADAAAVLLAGLVRERPYPRRNR